MSDPRIAYFFKKFYRNIIKWWFVIYNPIARKIWPTKEEEEQALAKEEMESAENQDEETEAVEEAPIDDDTYNATTKSYSGRYGKEPLAQEDTYTLEEILKLSSSQNSIDNIVASTLTPARLSDTDKAVIEEAKQIYERLLKEAEEDRQKKQAEIDAAAAAYELNMQLQENS
ncbi:MAG: hypothetical protein IJ326_01625 [Lachnospiraceae bacterium]|nr:hypothetical protein [Lachnospiraceae bacterium]